MVQSPAWAVVVRATAPKATAVANAVVEANLVPFITTPLKLISPPKEELPIDTSRPDGKLPDIFSTFGNPQGAWPVIYFRCSSKEGTGYGKRFYYFFLYL